MGLCPLGDPLEVRDPAKRIGDGFTVKNFGSRRWLFQRIRISSVKAMDFHTPPLEVTGDKTLRSPIQTVLGKKPIPFTQVRQQRGSDGCHSAGGHQSGFSSANEGQFFMKADVTRSI